MTDTANVNDINGNLVRTQSGYGSDPANVHLNWRNQEFTLAANKTLEVRLSGTLTGVNWGNAGSDRAFPFVIAIRRILD